MPKKVISLVLCAFYAIGLLNVSAESEEIKNAVVENLAAEEIASEKNTYILSLDDAIKMAQKDNPQFISLDVKIKNAESQVNYAKKSMKDMQNFKGQLKIPDNLDMIAVIKGYGVEAAKIALETAQLEKEKAMNTLAYNVTEQYFNVKLSERAVASVKESYELSLKNKQAADTQFELGMISELEKSEIDIMVEEAKNAYDKQVMNLELAREALKISLQIENTEADITLTDDINYVEFTGSLEDGIKEAEKNRYDLYALKKSCDLTFFYRDVAKLCGIPSSQYYDANNNAVQAEYTYTNTKKLIALSIRTSHNAITNAAMELSVAQKRLELLKKQSEVAKLKYELGMIGNIEYMQAVNSAYNQQTVYESALLKHKLATQKYSYEISLGL